MRVIQIVPSVGDESSGPSYSVPGLCRGLTDNGVDVSLHFLGRMPTQLQDAPYVVKNYSCVDKFHLGMSSTMLQGLKAACQTADIIHDNSLWMMPNVYPAWAVKGTKCKLVVAPRGTLAAWSLKKGWLKKKLFGMLLQNQVLRRADMFHATSEKEYEEIRALGYKQPIAIVPIGMDIPTFEHSNIQTFKYSPRWGTPGLKKVVFFGRLHQVKAVDRLVQAWELLNRTIEQSKNRTIEQWELLIAGPDNGIRTELEQYIADHKIPRVTFVGEINGPAKYEFLSMADLYVLPSHTENFGVTVAEALACGTPVIVSKGTPWQGVETCGRISQSNNVSSVALAKEDRTSEQRVLRSFSEGGSNNSCCGKWVENSPESLAAALAELMALSDDERRTMGECGQAWIKRDFSWEGVGAKMKAVYDWLCDSRLWDKPECVII